MSRSAFSTVLAAVVAVLWFGFGPAVIPAQAAGSGAAGAVTRCLDDVGGARGAGAAVELEACDGSAEQHWAWVGASLQINGLCLATADGSALLEPCDGTASQRWSVRDGRLVGGSGQCLNEPGGAGGAGRGGDTPVLGPCGSGDAQQWSMPPAPKTPVLTWVLLGLGAVGLSALVIVLSLARVQRGVGSFLGGTVRALIPRRPFRPSAEVARLLSDRATVGDAVRALRAAGRGRGWWPYAVAVSAAETTVWLAGLDVPAPGAPWRSVPGDRLAWAVSRADLAQVQSDGARTDLDVSGWPVDPVVLGVGQDTVVVLDVSQADGVLVIEGDEQTAELVGAAIREQMTSGEVMVRGSGAYPALGRTNWTLDVAEDGWIGIHGRELWFARATGAAARGHDDVVVLEEVGSEARVGQAEDAPAAASPGAEGKQGTNSAAGTEAAGTETAGGGASGPEAAATLTEPRVAEPRAITPKAAASPATSAEPFDFDAEVEPVDLGSIAVSSADTSAEDDRKPGTA